VYSGEYDICVATLSVYPHRASLKNMPGHGGIEPTTFGILAQSSSNYDIDSDVLLSGCLHDGNWDDFDAFPSTG
jgi:hypothetical protein